MVSFSCEACGDVLTKKKLDPHRNQCRGASFTCLDCMVHFQGSDYRSHTSCISEAQKYQGHLYRDPKKSKTERRASVNDKENSRAMIPRGVYIEDEGDEMNAVAVIDVPPRAPTPPPAPEALEAPNVNVFDYLTSEPSPQGKGRALPNGTQQRQLEHSQGVNNTDSQYSQYSQFSNGDGTQFLEHGYSYGNAPIQPGFERFESWNANFQDSQTIMPPPYTTPAAKDRRDKKDKSDKKRKRGQVEEIGLSTAKRPVSREELMLDVPATTPAERILHSGLTGGLSRLVTDAEYNDARLAQPPQTISPTKRNKRDKDPRDTKDDRRKTSHTSNGSSRAVSAYLSEKPSKREKDDRRVSSYGSNDSARAPSHISNSKSRRRESLSSDDEHSRASRSRSLKPSLARSDRQTSVQPSESNQLIADRQRADLFMSFITKGPESERGYSINKALKRYHRELDLPTSQERDEVDKELWKSLRLRRNSRGEIVLFA